MYERKFTYTSATRTSTAAYAGNVGKHKNYKTKKLQKQIPKAIRTNPQTAGATDFLFLNRLYRKWIKAPFPHHHHQRGWVRSRGPEDGPAALQDLCPQDAGELERGVIPCPIYIKGASECRVLLSLNNESFIN